MGGCRTGCTGILSSPLCLPLPHPPPSNHSWDPATQLRSPPSPLLPPRHPPHPSYPYPNTPTLLPPLETPPPARPAASGTYLAFRFAQAGLAHAPVPITTPGDVLPHAAQLRALFTNGHASPPAASPGVRVVLCCAASPGARADVAGNALRVLIRGAGARTDQSFTPLSVQWADGVLARLAYTARKVFVLARGARAQLRVRLWDGRGGSRRREGTGGSRGARGVGGW